MLKSLKYIQCNRKQLAKNGIFFILIANGG